MSSAEPSSRRAVRLAWVLRGLLVAVFLCLVGRYWHPYFGFTQLLQFDESAEAVMLPSLRDGPIYVYRDTGGYDGLYYAQMAASPGLQDPGLREAIDSLGYRGRRMLLSWVAWLVGGRDPMTAARAYAGLNIVAWLGLAALLWRLLPTTDWRGTVAWAGILFSAGALHSVRLSLTDLSALALITASGLLLARQQANKATGLLAVATLARETVLLAAVALLPASLRDWRAWLRAGVRGLLVALPLAAWLVYLRLCVGWPEPGLSNFTLPVSGLVEKWCETLVALELEPNGALAVTTLLSLVALTVQFLYLVIRPQWRDLWWRTGIVYVGLMLCLGTAVWEGFPGAATRVLLPMSLAFNVLAVRSRAGALWLLLGNLSVFNGVQAMWNVPGSDPHELMSRWSWHRVMRLETDSRWAVAEWNSDHRWSWCPQDGRLTLQVWPHSAPMRIQLSVRGIKPRPFEVRHEGKILWQGQIGDRPQWIELPLLPVPPKGLVLDLHSSAEPEMENNGPYSRALGFACFGVRVVE
jgi:hypothetical protein